MSKKDKKGDAGSDQERRVRHVAVSHRHRLGSRRTRPTTELVPASKTDRWPYEREKVCSSKWQFHKERRRKDRLYGHKTRTMEKHEVPSLRRDTPTGVRKQDSGSRAQRCVQSSTGSQRQLHPELDHGRKDVADGKRWSVPA